MRLLIFRRAAAAAAAGATGLLCAAAEAQTTAPAAVALEPVTVTATRSESAPFDVPAAVDVIDGERLRSAGRPQVNLSEGLGLVPGLAARERQNYAQDLQLSIRGFGARSTFGVRGVRLYVDGIPATMPDGQGQLSHIDLGTVERIEVLRGPYSVLYGNSSGGVVQVFTAPGSGTAVVEPGFAMGSDGLRRTSVRASGSSGDLGYTLGTSRFETDGYRDHSAARRDVANARLDLALGEGRALTLVANAVDLRADDPLGLGRVQFEASPRSVDPVATTFDTRKTVNQRQVGLTYQHRIDANNSVRLMGYLGERENDQFQAIPIATQLPATHPGGVIGLQREYRGTDLRWTGQRRLGGAPLELVVGLAHDTLDERRRGWQNFAGATVGVLGALRRDEDNRVTSTDPYLQGTWKPAERWTLNAGVRRSSVRFDSRDRYIVGGTGVNGAIGANGDDSAATRFSATLPVAGALFALTPAVNLYASAGRGFETPTLNESAYRPTGASGLQTALRPSKSDNFEAGAKGRHRLGAGPRIDWTAAVFQTDTADEIVTQTNLGGRSTFQNAGATRRRGVELSLAARQGDWSAQLAQGWLDARYRDAFRTCTGVPCAAPNATVPAGNRIPGTARSTVAAEVGWQRAGWTTGLEARYVGAVPVNDANSDAAPGYMAWATHAGYAFSTGRWTWRATARIDNLFDRKYAGSVIVNEGNGRFFEPAPGRTWVVGLGGRYAF